jgi:hypothetical protein
VFRQGSRSARLKFGVKLPPTQKSEFDELPHNSKSLSWSENRTAEIVNQIVYGISFQQYCCREITASIPVSLCVQSSRRE